MLRRRFPHTTYGNIVASCCIIARHISSPLTLAWQKHAAGSSVNANAMAVWAALATRACSCHHVCCSRFTWSWLLDLLPQIWARPCLETSEATHPSRLTKQGNFVNSGAWLHKVRLPCLNLNSWFMRFTFLLVDASRVFLCFMEASALVIWLHGLQLRWDYLLNDSRKFAQQSVCHVNNLQRMPTSAEAILCLSHPAATYRNQERLAATDFPNNFAELRWCEDSVPFPLGQMAVARISSLTQTLVDVIHGSCNKNVDLFKDFGSVWFFLQQSICETPANGHTYSNFKEIGELTMLPQKRLKRILDTQEFHIILIQLVSCGLVVSKYLKLLSLAPLFLLPGNFFPRLVRFASTAYHWRRGTCGHAGGYRPFLVQY